MFCAGSCWSDLRGCENGEDNVVPGLAARPVWRRLQKLSCYKVHHELAHGSGNLELLVGLLVYDTSSTDQRVLFCPIPFSGASTTRTVHRKSESSVASPQTLDNNHEAFGELIMANHDM